MRNDWPERRVNSNNARAAQLHASPMKHDQSSMMLADVGLTNLLTFV
jgi:hypothetical protein